MDSMDVDAVLLLSFGGPEGPEQVRAVPGERHPRPRHPARTARRRRRALPALRRRLADQRHQPRADRRSCEPNSTIAAPTAGLLRQPQLGPVRRGHRRADARQRDSPGGGVRHVGLGRVLELHAVRRGHRPGPRGGRGAARRSWSSCASTSTIRCSSRCSPTAIAPRRRRCPTSCARTPGWCSPRIPFRSRPTIAGAAQDLYSRQVAYAARLVAAAAGYDDYDQVWQSRSGPPQVPWLEPDVGDHLTALAAAGTKAVIVCPIGFVADHIEVVWDLDHELRQQAEQAGHRVRPGGHAQRRPAVRAAGRRPDRRAARAAATPARVPGPDAPPLQGFSVNGGGVHAELRLASASACQAECRIALTAAIRAERTTPVSGRSASLAICTSEDDCSPIGISPELTVMIASTWAAFSSTRTARDGAWSGSLVPPAGFQHLLDESARVGDVGAVARRGWRPARRRPTGRPNAVRTRPRRGRGVRGAARRAPSTPSTTTRSVSGSKSDSSSSVVSSYSKSGTRPTAADGSRRDEDRLTRGDRVALELGARRQPAHVAGHRQHHRRWRARRRRGPAAVRSVCSSDTAPASVRSGHGSPVRPAATES